MRQGLELWDVELERALVADLPAGPLARLGQGVSHRPALLVLRGHRDGVLARGGLDGIPEQQLILSSAFVCIVGLPCKGQREPHSPGWKGGPRGPLQGPRWSPRPCSWVVMRACRPAAAWAGPRALGGGPQELRQGPPFFEGPSPRPEQVGCQLQPFLDRIQRLGVTGAPSEKTEPCWALCSWSEIRRVLTDLPITAISRCRPTNGCRFPRWTRAGRRPLGRMRQEQLRLQEKLLLHSRDIVLSHANQEQKKRKEGPAARVGRRVRDFGRTVHENVRLHRGSNEGSYKLVVPKFASLTRAGGFQLERITSDVFQCGGFDWRIALYPRGNKGSPGFQEGHLSVYLEVTNTGRLEQAGSKGQPTASLRGLEKAGSSGTGLVGTHRVHDPFGASALDRGAGQPALPTALHRVRLWGRGGRAGMGL